MKRYRPLPGATPKGVLDIVIPMKFPAGATSACTRAMP